MTLLAQNNLIPILIVLVLGIAIAWWIFRPKAAPRIETKAESSVAERQAEPLVREMPDTREGNGLIDEGAAAATDVAGHFMGVEAHAQLPGAEGPPDNLQTMKGVGPKFAALLNENGITRFEQVARLSAGEIEALDRRLGAFSGRIARDRLVDQAHYLARGDRDGFEARFGKLGGA